MELQDVRECRLHFAESEVADETGCEAAAIDIGEVGGIERAPPQRSVARELDVQQDGIIAEISPCGGILFRREEDAASPHQGDAHKLGYLPEVAKEDA